MPSWTRILLPLRKFFVPQKTVTPLIAVGIGSADRELPKEFADVATVKIRDIMLKQLGGNKEAITKMSPREITALAENVMKEAKATGIVLPGSTNTIAEIFQNKNAKVPTRLDVPTANSIFKMAQTVQALSEKTPILASCDGAQYPTVALGGEVTPVLNDGLIKHDGMSAHDIAVKKGSWLGKEATKISKQRDAHGNIIIRNTPSTHPLFITKTPDDAEVLAHAPDGSPCVVELDEITMAILDHPEAGTVVSEKNQQENAMQSRIFGEDFFANEKEDFSEQNKLFWKIIRDKFIADASVERAPTITPNTKISPRISEILSAPSIEKLSETRVSMAPHSSR